jgi:predicted enzyme related to lactoylglutathione lyase
MSLRVDCTAIDAHDPGSLGQWWAELLGWRLEVDDDGDVVLWPPQGETATPICFFAAPDDKQVKNRLHLDLRPDDQAAEVARAEAMGARRVDIGQGEQTWVVLADPEGNEFCILRARPPGDG